MRVYHLMKEKWAREALKLRRLKLSLLDDMNDPFELLAVSLVDRQDRVDFRQLRKELSQEIGVLCFSRSWSNPVLWSHYGDRHHGVCLGFDVPDHALTEVDYQLERFTANDGNRSDETSVKELADKLLTTKFEHWRYEDEVRVVLRLEGMKPESGLFFVRFSSDLRLREVISGPRSALSLADVRALLTEEDRNVTLTQGRLAFGSFKVVKNKAAKDA
jgi:hypothetical protein